MDAQTTAAPERTGPRGAEMSIERCPERVTISFSGQVVADTRDALTLVEQGHQPVLYVPRGDIDMSLLERTAKSTHCPRKGDCSYFSVAVDGRRAENAAWSYEAPFPSAIAIRDHIAFYRSQVDVRHQGPA